MRSPESDPPEHFTQTRATGAASRSESATIPHEDLTGQRFGRLTVLGQAESRMQRRRWHCMCDCGETTTVPTHHLKSENTRSCGCLSRDSAAIRRRLFNEARMTHGMTKSATWSSWRGMICRCTVPVTNGYAYYGGRGVKVDRRWVGTGGFARFLEDVGERPLRTTLGRIGDTGDYVPHNVRWMTHDEQLEQRRLRRGQRAHAAAI